MNVQSQPLISVIMPCYNSGRYLADSMASVLEQTYQPLELIIIDDGSTDNSPEQIKSVNDSRITFIQQPNGGVCSARNRGLAVAQGKFVAFLDADDYWDRHFLMQLHQTLDTKPHAILAYCGWKNIGLSGGRGEPYVPPDYEADNKLEALLKSCPWPIHAALTRKEALLKVGGFDERFKTSEDYRLWLEIACGQEIVRAPEVLAYYRHHDDDQATTDRLRLALNQWQVQREFISTHPAFEQQLGRKRIRELIEGGLLHKGFEAYWQRDLPAARGIFRKVMRCGYGRPTDWRYMLPALLPFNLHKWLIQRFKKPTGVDA